MPWQDARLMHHRVGSVPPGELRIQWLAFFLTTQFQFWGMLTVNAWYVPPELCRDLTAALLMSLARHKRVSAVQLYMWVNACQRLLFGIQLIRPNMGSFIGVPPTSQYDNYSAGAPVVQISPGGMVSGSRASRSRNMLLLGTSACQIYTVS